MRRNNRTIKESFHIALYRTGYTTIPKVMIEDLAEICKEQLNMFPAKHGVSSYYSPEALVTGKILEYDRHCKYLYGEYIQAHNENLKQSSMTKCMIDAIYLWPNNNMQGGHILMNLNTSKWMTCSKITPVPLTQLVRNHVEYMA